MGRAVDTTFGWLHEKQLRVLLLDCIAVRVGVTLNATSHHRDGEAAYMSLNGILCWATSLTASQGTQQCGGENRFEPRNEDAVTVTGCSITLSGSGNVPLTVRVWTNLDRRNAKEESFGITNVVIQTVAPGNCCSGRDSFGYC